MNTLMRFIILAFFLSLFSNSVTAQTEDDYHPFLSDKFNLGIGVFWPKADFTLQVDGTVPSEEIDIDEALNISDRQASVALDFRWRFGKKWSLGGQYWSTDTSGGATLEEDVEWEDVVFKEGTFVEGGAGIDVARIFVGREFFTNSPKHEFGAGLGLHWMSLDTYLEGEIILEDGGAAIERVSATAEFPLPNIGVWYMYSWSPKWMLATRIDWLSANIGDYSGGLWDAQFGVNYQAFKNIGFGFYYKAFILDVDVDKGDWQGSADFNQKGPMLTLTASW